MNWVTITEEKTVRKVAIVGVILMSFLGTGCASYMQNFDGWFSMDMDKIRANQRALGNSRFTDFSEKPLAQENQKQAKKVLKEIKNAPKNDQEVDVFIIGISAK